jgi:hypothetical protein
VKEFCVRPSYHLRALKHWRKHGLVKSSVSNVAKSWSCVHFFLHWRQNKSKAEKFDIINELKIFEKDALSACSGLFAGEYNPS